MDVVALRIKLQRITLFLHLTGQYVADYEQLICVFGSTASFHIVLKNRSLLCCCFCCCCFCWCSCITLSSHKVTLMRHSLSSASWMLLKLIHNFKTHKIISTLLRFKVLTADETEFMVSWVLTPCSAVVGYQRFGGPWIYSSTLKMEVSRSSETLAPKHHTKRYNKWQDRKFVIRVNSRSQTTGISFTRS
jgi:hypothetical protein